MKAGDVLLELDPTETFADREAQARDLEAARAEALRRKVSDRSRSNRLPPALADRVHGRYRGARPTSGRRGAER